MELEAIDFMSLLPVECDALLNSLLRSHAAILIFCVSQWVYISLKDFADLNKMGHLYRG